MFAIGSTATITRNPVPQNGPKEEPVTVYVGKIPKTIPDDMIRKFLEVRFPFKLEQEHKNKLKFIWTNQNVFHYSYISAVEN